MNPDTEGKEVEEVSLPRAEYERLQARVKELEDLREVMLRTAADFENAKKRLAKEREEFIKFSQESLLRELLPVFDNLQRALAHAREGDPQNLKSVVTGVQLVFKQLSDLLKNQGLKQLETVGQKFDPHFHEAVGFVEQAGKEDEVIEEVEPGYLFHDRLLKPAKVRVQIAPKKNGGAESSGEDEEKKDEIT